MENKCQSSGIFGGLNHDFSDIYDKIPPAADEVKIIIEDEAVSDDYIPDIIDSLTKKVYIGSYCEKCGLKIKRSDFDGSGEK